MAKSHNEPLDIPQARPHEQAFVIGNKLYRHSMEDYYKRQAEYLSDELTYIKNVIKNS